MASVIELRKKKKYKWNDEKNEQRFQQALSEKAEKAGGAAQQAAKAARRVAAKAQERTGAGQGETLPRPSNSRQTYQGYYEQKQNSREMGRARESSSRLQSMRQYRKELSGRLFSPNEWDRKEIERKGVDRWQYGLKEQLSTLDERIKKQQEENSQNLARAMEAKRGYLSPEYQKAAGETPRQQSALRDQQTRQKSMEKAKKEIQQRINYPTKNDLKEIGRMGMDAWKAEMQKDLQYLERALERNREAQKEASRQDFETRQRAKRKELEDVLLAPDAKETIARAGQGTGNSRMERTAAYLTGRGGRQEEELDFLTEDEKRTLLYFAGKGDQGAMEQYMEVIRRDLQRRRQEAKNQQTADWAEKHKALAVGKNIAGSLLSPLALVETGGQALENAITGNDAPVNTASPLMAGAQMQKATQEGITRSMSPTGRFLANTGLSIGQNLVRLPLGPGAALGSMAASAGGQTAMDAAERGGRAGQALGLGLLSGTVEALTEKLPLDKLFRMADEGGESLKQAAKQVLKQAAKQVLKQAGMEAGEEAVSEIAGTVADRIIMTDKSEMENTIRKLMNRDVSRKEATREAAIQYFVQNPALAAAGGALSGGIMGTGAQAYNALSPTQRRYRALQKAAEQRRKAEQEAEEYDQWKQEWAARDAQTLAQREAAQQAPVPAEPIQAAAQEEKLVPFDFDEGQMMQNGTEMENPALLGQEGMEQRPMQAETGLEQKDTLFSIDANGRQVVSPEGIRTIQELGKKLGRTVTWTEEENFNGSYDPQTGEIKISKYTKNPALFVFKHELTHSLEGTPAYRELQKHIMQSPELMTFAKSLGGNVSMLARAKQKSYQAAGKEIDLDQAMREVVADYVGSNLFTDEKSIRSLAKAKPNVAQRILGWIERTYKKIRGQWGTEEKWLFKAEQIYRNALQQSRKAPAQGEAAEELSIGREFMEEYKALLERYGPELRQEDEAPAGEQPSPAMSRKGQKFMEGNERKTAEKIAQAMDIPKQAKKDRLLPAIQKMSQEIGETGKISQETADAAFEEAYKSGLVVLDDFYKTYKGLRDELRTTRLQISPRDRADITEFEDFRKSNMGKLLIVKENGIPVDSKYQELRSRYPELFPEDITHPAEQLEAIADIRNKIEKTGLSLDQYYGPDADRFKAYARNEFDKALDFLKEGAGYVKRYEDDRLEARRPVKLDEGTMEEVRTAYEENKKLQRAAERATAKNLLTNYDQRQVKRLLAGDIMPDELPRGTNRQGVMEVYEAKKAQQDNMKAVRQYRAQLKESRMQRGLDLIEGADHWKDKNIGFGYSRETAERNMLDIMSKQEAENMIAAYFRPIHKAEANSIREQNKLRKQVKALKISTKPEYQIQYKDPNQGDLMVDAKVSESALVQLLGEEIISLDQIRKAGADGAKIQKAANTMRTIYNQLFDEINNALMQNGYAPMESRKNYFPHFTDQGGGDWLEKAMHFLGMSKVDELPTDIAGMTHTFRPGKKWFGNMLRRKGGATDYDAIKGFDRYLNGAADVIYHTDNIQDLRALENAIRYKYSDKGTKEEIEALRENRDIGEDAKELMIQGLLERDNQHLPQFVTWLRNYTDILAGKKHPSDRSVEHEFGRRVYDIVRRLSGRVAANMVGVSPGSWLTNFVPLTQALGPGRNLSLLRGIYDTIRSRVQSDGFAEASTFLTNRRGTDPLYRGWAEKVADFATKGMFYIDSFTSEAITRAKYYENLKNGMSEEAALEQADDWAASLIGDRSKGAMPTVFSKKNPIAKSLTMFQLEVNNQLSFFFKDLPREEKERGILLLSAKLLEIFIGAKLFNDALEKFAGRRAALDPLEFFNDLTGDWSGKKVRNFWDILGGAEAIETKEPEQKSQALLNAWGDVADQIPFVGSLIGGDGGRLPVASALPDVKNLAKLADREVAWEKKKQILTEEGINAGAYLLLPTGGTQLKRAFEALAMKKARGNYTMNNKGEKELRYLSEGGGDFVKSLLFGRYATEEGREYIESGFKRLSAKKTRIVDEAESQGIDRYAAKEIMDDAAKFEKDWDFRRYLLKRDDLTPDQKKWIDKNLFDHSKVWERIDYSGDEALMEMTGKSKATNERVLEAINADIDAAIYQRAYEAQKGIKSDKDGKGETIPLSRDKKRKAAVQEAVGDELTRAELKRLYDILDISKKVR